MDPGLQLASLEYCSGCRMVISIEHEVKDSQFLITSSRGSFFEQGAYLNGDPAGLRGTDCDFRRYNVDLFVCLANRVRGFSGGVFVLIHRKPDRTLLYVISQYYEVLQKRKFFRE